MNMRSQSHFEYTTKLIFVFVPKGLYQGDKTNNDVPGIISGVLFFSGKSFPL